MIVGKGGEEELPAPREKACDLPHPGEVLVKPMRPDTQGTLFHSLPLRLSWDAWLTMHLLCPNHRQMIEDTAFGHLNL